VVVPTHDPVADHGRRYAERLQAAGTPARLTEYPGAGHAFLSMPGVAQQAEAARAEILEFLSVTVMCPSHPEVNSLFEQMGGVLPVADEAAFNVFSALTGTLTAHYWYLATLTSWAAGQGIASDDADRYVRGLFQGVGRALSDETRSLHQLAADHETPNGNNERIRTTWFDPANSEALKKALDDLLADLK